MRRLRQAEVRNYIKFEGGRSCTAVPLCGVLTETSTQSGNLERSGRGQAAFFFLGLQFSPPRNLNNFFLFISKGIGNLGKVSPFLSVRLAMLLLIKILPMHRGVIFNPLPGVYLIKNVFFSLFLLSPSLVEAFLELE